MKITNKLGLPEQMVNSVSTEPHNAEGCVSATTLKQGAKEIVLTKRHWNELETDVSDMLWAMFGTAFHIQMEHETENTFVEEFFKQKVGSKFVTGRLDNYDMKNGIIWDYKTTSVFKIKNKSFDEWKFQGLVYAWLLKQQNLPVNECRFIACLKDWRRSEAKKDPNYPQLQVYIYRFDVTEELLYEVEQKIKSKITEIESAEKLADDDIPICTEEERWSKPPTFAVMKKGRKTAVKLCDSRDNAELYIKAVKKDNEELYIEERAGSDGKCCDYCSCCEFCNYWKEHYGESLENKEIA